jgi:chromosome segregation ATPase
MIGLAVEILACLLVAAGIGGICGWLLRHTSVTKLNRHIYDVTTALHQKDQLLHETQLALKAKVSTILLYDSKLSAAQATTQSHQQELQVQTERVRSLEDQLRVAQQQLSQTSGTPNALQEEETDPAASLATMEEEIRSLRAYNSELEDSLAEAERELDATSSKAAALQRQLNELRALQQQLAENQRPAGESSDPSSGRPSRSNRDSSSAPAGNEIDQLGLDMTPHQPASD